MIVSGDVRQFSNNSHRLGPDDRRLDRIARNTGRRYVAIPKRYGDGCDGINRMALERDRRHARHRLVQSMVHGLGRMWLRR